MKKPIILILTGMALMSLLSSCTTSDPARQVTRKCPIKYVEGDRASEVSAQGFKWTQGKVYVTDNCWGNSLAIGSWADAQGIKNKVVARGNHQTLLVGDKEIDYVYGIGLVARKTNNKLGR